MVGRSFLAFPAALVHRWCMEDPLLIAVHGHAEGNHETLC